MISVEKGGVVLFQCLCFDIIIWPLWQQIWSAAKHLKNISQDSTQLANYFKYRPDTLALLQGQAYVHMHTHIHELSFLVTEHMCSDIGDKLLIALPEGHLVLLSLQLYQDMKVWAQCSASRLLYTLQFFMRPLNRFGYTWKETSSLSPVCHLQYYSKEWHCILKVEVLWGPGARLFLN